MERKAQAIERKIKRIKAQLGELRPGYLSRQYNVCGNPACRCQSDPAARHGPYYQLGWTRNRKSTTRFIRQPEVTTVRAQLGNYQRLQRLVDQWVQASLELCELRLQRARATRD